MNYTHYKKFSEVPITAFISYKILTLKYIKFLVRTSLILEETNLYLLEAYTKNFYVSFSKLSTFFNKTLGANLIGHSLILKVQNDSTNKYPYNYYEYLVPKKKINYYFTPAYLESMYISLSKFDRFKKNNLKLYLLSFTENYLIIYFHGILLKHKSIKYKERKLKQLIYHNLRNFLKYQKNINFSFKTAFYDFLKLNYVFCNYLKLRKKVVKKNLKIIKKRKKNKIKNKIVSIQFKRYSKKQKFLNYRILRQKVTMNIDN